MRSLAALPVALLALLTSLASAQDTSGLGINVTHPVTCSRPTQNGDSIAVHYKGTLLSTGAEFDESYKRGAPFTFTLGAGRVIKGWDLGLLDMCPGEKRTLTIPSELAYGARGVGMIPGGATLVFATELIGISGVKEEEVTAIETTSSAVATTATTEAQFGIATAAATPPTTTTTIDAAPESESLAATPINHHPTAFPTSTSTSPHAAAEEGQAECHLLGPFALLVQAALGGVAILSLVWKRYRETPKRPWKIFFFDVSKQVVGSMLTHVLNLAMSIFGAVDVVNVAATVGAQLKQDVEAQGGEGGRAPNPCSFYLLNLGIDTTIGIPVLYILLQILHALFLHTPLANPPTSIKSGHYGTPPHTTWWLKQSLLYFLGLLGMKIFVFFLFAAMPWLPWVGDWALRWTKGNEAVEVVFVMFVFPLVMNCMQYWIIDGLIKEGKNKDGGEDKGQYEEIGQGEEGDDVERGRLNGEEDEEEGSVEEVNVEPDVVGKTQGRKAPLREVNPTPIPDR